MAETLRTLTRDDLYTGFTEVWKSEELNPSVVTMRQFQDRPGLRLQKYSSLPYEVRIQNPVGFTLIGAALSEDSYQNSYNKPSLELHNVVARLRGLDGIIPTKVLFELEVCADAVAREVAKKQAEEAEKLTDFVAGKELYLVGTNREAVCAPGQIAFAGRLVAFDALQLGPTTQLKPVVEGWEGQQGYMPMAGRDSLVVSSLPYLEISA
ncbi:hypothetical protein KC976_00235 [Candidatus Saccharibacteria bacterium]|nr:hypothetical protein [Candidatus Saccharibacteria bacterium]